MKVFEDEDGTVKDLKGNEPQSTQSECKPREKSIVRNSKGNLEEFEQDNLENSGREQFFWHYPHSELPIRDVTQKTEPHIEIGAENYLRPCIQPNVRGFCHSREKYLFLCTTCKNRKASKFFGKRFVIGYIKKRFWKNMGDRLAVIGDMYIVPFNEKLEYGTLGFSRNRGMQIFGIKGTQKLVALIESHENIRKKCMKEMTKVEIKERECGSNIPVDMECLSLKNRCLFKSNCLRRKF
jgi:hypothetical protein